MNDYNNYSKEQLIEIISNLKDEINKQEKSIEVYQKLLNSLQKSLKTFTMEMVVAGGELRHQALRLVSEHNFKQFDAYRDSLNYTQESLLNRLNEILKTMTKDSTGH